MRKKPNPKFFMALTVLTLVLGLGLVSFQYSALSDAKDRVAKLKKDALDEGELERQLRSSTTDLQQCSARLNHLEKGIPELAYVPTMLKELENVGTENGLQILGVRPVPKQVSPKDQKEKKSSSKKKYTELDIEVSGRGTYNAVKAFVRALQSFPKIVAARSVAMTPKQETNVVGSPKLDVTISLRSYLFPPDKSEMKPAVDPAEQASAPAPQAASWNRKEVPNAS